jgi:hypothetical protein
MNTLKQNKSKMIEELTQLGFDRHKITKAIDFVYGLDTKDGYTQADLGLITAIRTCIIAIWSGLKMMEKNGDSSSIYEAVVMLQQIVVKYYDLEPSKLNYNGNQN